MSLRLTGCVHRAQVMALVKSFMPNDYRLSLVQYNQQRSARPPARPARRVAATTPTRARRLSRPRACEGALRQATAQMRLSLRSYNAYVFCASSRYVSAWKRP